MNKGFEDLIEHVLLVLIIVGVLMYIGLNTNGYFEGKTVKEDYKPCDPCLCKIDKESCDDYYSLLEQIP